MAAESSISFRPIEDSDQEFLLRVYASTRADELAVVPWTEKEKEDFVRFQFEAQHSHYQEHFPEAEYLILEVDSQPVGRLYVDRREDEHRLIDIALLPEHRQKGFGGKLLEDLLDEARSVGKPVRIHVERNNPAMHLYDRLGFKSIEDQGVYYLMEWLPDTPEPQAEE